MRRTRAVSCCRYLEGKDRGQEEHRRSTTKDRRTEGKPRSVVTTARASNSAAGGGGTRRSAAGSCPEDGCTATYRGPCWWQTRAAPGDCRVRRVEGHTQACAHTSQSRQWGGQVATKPQNKHPPNHPAPASTQHATSALQASSTHLNMNAMRCVPKGCSAKSTTRMATDMPTTVDWVIPVLYSMPSMADTCMDSTVQYRAGSARSSTVQLVPAFMHAGRQKRQGGRW